MVRDLAELQDEVIARGYTRNFGRHDQPLPEIVGSNLRIVDTVSFDVGTDPGDDVTMYLLAAAEEKGYVILANSFHADARNAAFIDALLAKSKTRTR